MGEWFDKKNDGEIHQGMNSSTPIFNECGEIIGYLAREEDVEELKNAQQNLIAREIAEKANGCKTTFLSNMSHEIRTPLNAIIGFAQILQRDGTFSLKQKQQVHTILRSSEHLLKLINNILDLSKIESGNMTVNNNDFCLYDLVKDLSMMFSLQAQDKNIQFVIIYEEDVPKYILSDEGKIRQLLINLVGNAIKFTVTGSVTIKVSAKPTKETDKYLMKFEVIDTGVGIAPDETEDVFESFHQAQAGIKTGGTGLGLSISKHFVELLGGTISVESQLNKGSIFSTSFVITAVEKRMEKAVESYENVISLKPGIGPFRVLVVDDIILNRELLIDVLEPLGFQTKEAYCAQEVLDLLKQWEPHCILLDTQMSVMDGYEVIKQIKETVKGKETLVIAVTASTFEKDIKRVMETGTDFFLCKPFQLEELYKMLKSIDGLEYVYSKNVETSKEEVEEELELLTKDKLQVLPPEKIKEMSDAVKEGNIVRLRKLIQEIGNENSWIAHRLGGLVKGYDYDILTELLQGEGE